MQNSLKYFKMLEGTGLDGKHAETYLKVIEGAMKDNVATRLELYEVRSDLKIEIQEVRSDLKTEIQEVRAELKAEIQEVRAELKTEIQELRIEMRVGFQKISHEMTRKMGYMTFTSIAVMGVMMTFLKFFV